MSARETAELLLLLGRLVQAEGYHGDLSPAQWMALRFFARANSFSRTPSAFAEFQATTRGTATQTIKALETGGYLVRQRSEADGRSVSLRLTDKGHEVVVRDPFEVLVCAVDSLDAEEQTAMHHALHHVLTTVAASGPVEGIRPGFAPLIVAMSDPALPARVRKNSRVAFIGACPMPSITATFLPFSLIRIGTSPPKEK